MNPARTLVEGARAVVFDLDGTLVDTFEDLSKSLDTALQRHGLPAAPRTLVAAHVHHGLSATAEAVLAQFDAPPAKREAVVAAYAADYRARRHRASHLYPGVPAFLEECLRRGQRLAVCTNKAHAEAHELLALLGVAHRFETIVGIDTCGVAKPDPAPLRCALDRLDCMTGEAVFVGDSEIDARCARAGRVRFALHAAGYGAAGAQAVGCDAVFDAYAQLLRTVVAPDSGARSALLR